MVSYGDCVTTISLPSVRPPGERLHTALAYALAGLSRLQTALLTLLSVLLAPRRSAAPADVRPLVARPVVQVVRLAPSGTSGQGAEVLTGLGGGLRMPTLRLPALRIPDLRLPSLRMPSLRVPGLRSMVLPAVLLAEFVAGVLIGFYT